MTTAEVKRPVSAKETQTGTLPRMAPLNVPLLRRIQTMALLTYSLETTILLSLFAFICAIPLFWPLVVGYIIYSIMDDSSENGSRRWEWLRNLPVWKHFVDYFPVRLIKEVDLDPTKNYIFGYHPHGIIAFGAAAGFMTEGAGISKLFPGITATLLTLSSNFKIPFHRDFLLWMGACSVSRKSCTNILQSKPGNAIVIAVGGASESLNARPGVINLTLKRRLGFVRIAVETGARLVPVLSFGENEIYNQLNNESGSSVRHFQKKLQQTFGFTTPFFHGRGVFNYDIGLLPHRRPINVIIGEPIVPPIGISEKDKEEAVRKLHGQYMQALRDLYDKHKDTYAIDRIKDMEFIE
ncbi:diacylglycerol acyltransferase type 2A [Phycomyces nitens]|nr:diacylglycerol acyltransferase type 2A [Phycomyces nitens]